MADGSIIIDTRINNSKASTDLKKLTSEVVNSSNVMVNALNKVGKTIGSVFATGMVLKFGKTCLDVATETSNAWIGLNSIISGQGKSFKQAQQFIQEYVKDGLVPLNNAVGAYKNLALRGYSSDQIQKTMNALKNSATFARQSTYTLGEAVQTATEGLKNENSVVVDNAGVTKNVAKMWEDYAKSIGTTTNKLTQAQKIQAEVNGILEETKFQSNDASIYAQTYSGRLAQLNTALTNMKVAIGNAVQPIAKLFIPVITSAVGAVTQLFTAISGLLAMFGLQADSVETIANGIGDVATSAGNASDNLNDVADSTKKAGKTADKNLASFDKINVLDKSKQSSSGSGAGAGGGGASAGASLSTNISGLTQSTSALDGINFDNLINAFNNLKNAAEPLITTIKDGLKWFYDNILEPFAKWTITDLIPAFLNALAGALRVLNPLIKASQPILKWFWENFLKPIAEWTGGVIVKTLNNIAWALDTIGTWMEENQGTVTGMETAVAGFFGAWKVVQLVSFIEQAGGVVKALKLIKDAIWAVTGAKIVDKAETMYLTALYAKDFVVKVAQGTAALVKQAAQWVITTGLKIADTTATTAATAATWLFNAALAVLTSPITLIILAIGALIAVIVLLVKHWDKVKSALVTGFNFVKDKAIQFKDAFVGVFKSIWNGIKGIINSILGGIEGMANGVINGLNFMIRAMNKVKFDVPDWVPGLGGKTFGFNIKEMNRVSLPRLAQGAIVNNPGRGVPAVIGEAGKEAVLPLENNTEWMDLLVDKMGGRNVNINFTGDLAQLARILKPVIDTENSRVGNRMITGGI